MHALVEFLHFFSSSFCIFDNYPVLLQKLITAEEKARSSLGLGKVNGGAINAKASETQQESGKSKAKVAVIMLSKAIGVLRLQPISKKSFFV